MMRASTGSEGPGSRGSIPGEQDAFMQWWRARVLRQDAEDRRGPEGTAAQINTVKSITGLLQLYKRPSLTGKLATRGPLVPNPKRPLFPLGNQCPCQDHILEEGGSEEETPHPLPCACPPCLPKDGAWYPGLQISQPDEQQRCPAGEGISSLGLPPPSFLPTCSYLEQEVKPWASLPF